MVDVIAWITRVATIADGYLVAGQSLGTDLAYSL